MEIRINNISLQSGYIIGMIGDYSNFINTFKDLGFSKNNIILNKKRLNITGKRELLRNIVVVENNNDLLFLKVNEYMRSYVFNNVLVLKDYEKKIKDSLKIVGLSTTYLDKRMSELSYSERKFIFLAISLLSNPDILIFNDFFNGLDLKNKKKIFNIINQLTEKYNKIVVLCSNESELIYKYTKKVILISNDLVVFNDKTDLLYQDNIDLLVKHNINIPSTIKFTNLVLKNKGIKLNYNKDIRDLIKDIYKKV